MLSSGVDWADKPTCAAKEIGERLTFSAAGDFSQSVAEACELDKTLQRYRNPKGKTGIKGRGLLGKFGPNHAVDTIVTRSDPATGKLQGLVIDRVDGDGTTLAWPGGMINPGDDASITVRKEFTEEAVKEGAVVDRLFSECKEGVVYRGFVDDHRNTDIAWMETTAVHYHCTQEIGAGLTLEIKDTHTRSRASPGRTWTRSTPCTPLTTIGSARFASHCRRSSLAVPSWSSCAATLTRSGLSRSSRPVLKWRARAIWSRRQRSAALRLRGRGGHLRAPTFLSVSFATPNKVGWV